MPRENANGARAHPSRRVVPVGPELIRLYADYLHGEYGDIGSDYVFVNLFAAPRARVEACRRSMTWCRRLPARRRH